MTTEHEDIFGIYQLFDKYINQKINDETTKFLRRTTGIIRMR